MSVEGENEVQVASGDVESATNTDKVESQADTDNGKESEGSERPKKDGAQKRIDRLTREKYQLRAELDLARRQLEGGQVQQADNQISGDIQDIEAVVEQRLAVRDFQRKRDKIFAEAEKIGEFDREDFASIPVTSIMAETIMECDVAAKLVIYLTDNPEEAEKIASMSNARQAAALGKLETRLEGEEKPKASKSAAPEPIKPISASKASTGFRLGMSQAEYRALRANKQSSR